MFWVNARNHQVETSFLAITWKPDVINSFLFLIRTSAMKLVHLLGIFLKHPQNKNEHLIYS